MRLTEEGTSLTFHSIELRVALWREYNGRMKWGFRIRLGLFLLFIGWSLYYFLDFNGSVNDRLYLLFGGFLAMIAVGVILEINPFSPFKPHKDEEDKG